MILWVHWNTYFKIRIQLISQDYPMKVQHQLYPGSLFLISLKFWVYLHNFKLKGIHASVRNNIVRNILNWDSQSQHYWHSGPILLGFGGCCPLHCKMYKGYPCSVTDVNNTLSPTATIWNGSRHFTCPSGQNQSQQRATDLNKLSLLANHHHLKMRNPLWVGSNVALRKEKMLRPMIWVQIPILLPMAIWADGLGLEPGSAARQKGGLGLGI